MGRRACGDSLSGQGTVASGDPGAAAATTSRDPTERCTAAEVKLEAAGGSSMEEARSDGGDAASHCLRSALNARPPASQGCAAAGFAAWEGQWFQKGKKGTFLTR